MVWLPRFQEFLAPASSPLHVLPVVANQVLDSLAELAGAGSRVGDSTTEPYVVAKVIGTGPIGHEVIDVGGAYPMRSINAASVMRLLSI